MSGLSPSITRQTMENSIMSMIKGLGSKGPELLERLKAPPDERELKAQDKPTAWELEYAETNRKKARRGYSSLGEDDWGVTFDSLKVVPQNQELLERLKKWSPEMKRGVLLAGPVGTGKSTVCKAIINRFASPEFRCLFISMAEIMQQLRDAIGKRETTTGEEMDRFIAPELLIIDDLGAEKSTDWATEKLFLIFEKRAALRKHTFFTTNCTAAELGALYKERILDRLFEFCTWVKMPGSSFRRAQHAPEI